MGDCENGKNGQDKLPCTKSEIGHVDANLIDFDNTDDEDNLLDEVDTDEFEMQVANEAAQLHGQDGDSDIDEIQEIPGDLPELLFEFDPMNQGAGNSSNAGILEIPGISGASSSTEASGISQQASQDLSSDGDETSTSDAISGSLSNEASPAFNVIGDSLSEEIQEIPGDLPEVLVDFDPVNELVEGSSRGNSHEAVEQVEDLHGVVIGIIEERSAYPLDAEERPELAHSDSEKEPSPQRPDQLNPSHEARSERNRNGKSSGHTSNEDAESLRDPAEELNLHERSSELNPSAQNEKLIEEQLEPLSSSSQSPSYSGTSTTVTTPTDFQQDSSIQSASFSGSSTETPTDMEQDGGIQEASPTSLEQEIEMEDLDGGPTSDSEQNGGLQDRVADTFQAPLEQEHLSCGPDFSTDPEPQVDEHRNGGPDPEQPVEQVIGHLNGGPDSSPDTEQQVEQDNVNGDPDSKPDPEPQVERDIENLNGGPDSSPEPKVEQKVEHHNGRPNPEHTVEQKIEHLNGGPDPERQVEQVIENLNGGPDPEPPVEQKIEHLNGGPDPDPQVEQVIENLNGGPDPEQQEEGHLNGGGPNSGPDPGPPQERVLQLAANEEAVANPPAHGPPWEVNNNNQEQIIEHGHIPVDELREEEEGEANVAAAAEAVNEEENADEVDRPMIEILEE